jgi:hypothetical protein
MNKNRAKEDETICIPKETRRESYERIKATLTVRQRIVLRLLRDYGDMTAQEIADELFILSVTATTERNCSAPRLTELCELGLVTPVGKKTCYKTGRTVTVWSAVKKPAPQPPPDAQIRLEMKAWLGSLERGGNNEKKNSKTKPPGSNKSTAVLHMEISI